MKYEFIVDKGSLTLKHIKIKSLNYDKYLKENGNIFKFFLSASSEYSSRLIFINYNSISINNAYFFSDASLPSGFVKSEKPTQALKT